LRVGTGFDIHRLAEGRRLILGGVKIHHEKGLVGHSDGDALLHSIADALLGAAALGDIGQLFPDTDQRIEGIDSAEIVREVCALLKERSLTIENVDATIIAQEPRLTNHKASIRENVAKILNISAANVSIKAKTMEHLGPIGEGRAIAVQAVALLRNNN